MDVQAILDAKGDRVETIRPSQDLLTAARFLRAKGIGALVVSSDGESAEGLLAERDIVVALAEHPERVLAEKVSEVMNRHFASAKPDDSLEAVMATMTRHRQRHIPVVDCGRFVGLVSIGDVVNHRLADAELELRVARDYSIAHS